ncbi:MAG: SDR family NAD(P)-dependent oxidoreductase [Hyphomicrobiaceae bacterium]
MSLSVDLSGKRALVTGASSAGLGAHFARLLARSGAEIIVGARRLEPLQALVREIQETGGKARAVTLDVSDLSSVKTAVQNCDALDILVNNAGVTNTKRLLEQSEDDFDRIIATNLKGAWNTSVEVARAMQELGTPGSIINIASITGLRQATAITPYAVSKAGLVQMTKQMALELARHNIRVNALAPGYFKTDINRDFFETDAGKALAKRVPMRRIGTFDDLDGALLLLACDASQYMTGSVITIDGGHTVSSL